MASFYTEHNHWYPKNIDELDRCNELFNDVAPEFDPTHPGFNDEAYKKRRHVVTSLANNYKLGDPIPRCDYTEDEIKLWNTVYTGLRAAHPKYACKGYIEGIKKLEDAGMMGPDFIPQVGDLSEFLYANTKFKLRPIGGYVEPRDFLAHLAFRHFPCTQYIRHPKNIEYSPDPDGIHDIVGHLPMLLNPELADLTEKIGKISLGASDDMIHKLTSLYWFTIEVGLVKEGDQTKVYGAAILSSVAEMEYALGNRVPLLDFEPETVSVRQFIPTNYQEVYYTTSSITEALNRLELFSNKYKGGESCVKL